MPSRRDQIEMTDAEIQDFLDAQKTIILTTNGKDGYPHPMPMWFWRSEDGCIYCATYEKSQKIRNIEQDSKVSLLCEAGEEYSELKAVFIKADAELIKDTELAINVLARAGMGGDPDQMPPEAAKALREAIRPRAEKRLVIKCVPQKTISWDHAKLGGKY